MNSFSLATLTGTLLAVLGCGGSSTNSGGLLGGGSCPSSFTPCGGNVVGTWHLKSECMAMSSSSSSACAGESFSFAPGSTYGITYTFGANGTLSASVSGNMTATLRYPAACLHSDAGAAQACSDLNKILQSSSQQVGDAGTNNIKSLSISCSADSSGTCVCNENIGYSPYSITGSYTTSGTKITITALSVSGMPDGGVGDAGTSSAEDYCVSGSTLMIHSTSSSGGSGSVAVMTK